MLKVINLGCIRGNRRLFEGINLNLKPGDFLQLTGANGSGKTSLLRILCGLLTQAEGEVHWKDANIRSLGEDYFTSVTYLGHRNGVKDELSALENLRLSSALNGNEITVETGREVLKQVGLGGGGSLPARLLSEGQRRRVALGRLVVSNTSLWLLDEVLTSLDKNATRFVKSLIEWHLANGGIAVAATHQELELSAAVSFHRLELST